MQHNYFDDDVAGSYDQLHRQGDIAATVDVLEALAENGAVLEFAIGTGRIALPLAARGLSVKGIEFSAAMVAQLRKKEVGDPMEVVIGDMCSARVAGTFSLVCLVFNTIDNLTTQDAQVACFENAAAHLADGGRFVVETLLPPIQKIPFGETKRAFACDAAHLGIDTFDITTQCYSSSHVWMDQGQHSYLSVPFRYVWPAEMDLMARIAGLTLEHRWSDWAKNPFTNRSTSHISVWRKAA